MHFFFVTPSIFCNRLSAFPLKLQPCKVIAVFHVLVDINTYIQETWADRLDVRVEMKSCHYILWFICLNAHPEWWPFLPGASCLPLTHLILLFSSNHTCAMDINDSQHQMCFDVVFSDWFEALFGVLKVIFCSWIVNYKTRELQIHEQLRLEQLGCV